MNQIVSIEEIVGKITETIEGYPTKNLRWKAMDNIIVGMVKDPQWGKESLHEGYISCSWNKNGVITRTFKDRNGGLERKDLTLKM